MKKQILTILIFTSLAAGAQQKAVNRFALSGKIKGLEKGMMYLYYSNSSDARVKDSATIDNGKFSFRGKINGPPWLTWY